jgi:hypothetical protein
MGQFLRDPFVEWIIGTIITILSIAITVILSLRSRKFVTDGSNKKKGKRRGDNDTSILLPTHVDENKQSSSEKFERERLQQQYFQRMIDKAAALDRGKKRVKENIWNGMNETAAVEAVLKPHVSEYFGSRRIYSDFALLEHKSALQQYAHEEKQKYDSAQKH